MVALVQAALKEAGVTPADISCVAYTKVRCLRCCREAPARSQEALCGVRARLTSVTTALLGTHRAQGWAARW